MWNINVIIMIKMAIKMRMTPMRMTKTTLTKSIVQICKLWFLLWRRIYWVISSLFHKIRFHCSKSLHLIGATDGDNSNIPIRLIMWYPSWVSFSCFWPSMFSVFSVFWIFSWDFQFPKEGNISSIHNRAFD